MKTINLKLGNLQVTMQLEVQNRYEYCVWLYESGYRESKEGANCSTLHSALALARDWSQAAARRTERDHHCEVWREDTATGDVDLICEFYSTVRFEVAVDVRMFRS